jgi:hypothetical protein
LTAAQAVARLRQMIDTRREWLGLPPDTSDDAENLFRDGLARWEYPSGVNHGRVRETDPVAFAYGFAKQEIVARFENEGAVPEWRRWKNAVFSATPFAEVGVFRGRDDGDDSSGRGEDPRSPTWEENLGGTGSRDVFDDDDDLTYGRFLEYRQEQADRRTRKVDTAGRWAQFVEDCLAQLSTKDADVFWGYLKIPLAELAASANVQPSTIHYREQRVLDWVRREWIERHDEPVPEVLERRPRHGRIEITRHASKESRRARRRAGSFHAHEVRE